MLPRQFATHVDAPLWGGLLLIIDHCIQLSRVPCPARTAAWAAAAAPRSAPGVLLHSVKSSVRRIARLIVARLSALGVPSPVAGTNTRRTPPFLGPALNCPGKCESILQHDTEMVPPAIFGRLIQSCRLAAGEHQATVRNHLPPAKCMVMLNDPAMRSITVEFSCP